VEAMSEGKKAFVLVTAPAQVIPFFEEGRGLEKAGKVKEAKEVYERVLASTATFYGAYDRLAIIYRKEKDFENELRVVLHALYLGAFHWDDEADALSEKAHGFGESEEFKEVRLRHRKKFLTKWTERLSKLLST
jgi:tetratricopeptide (TPR) repeat protein